MIKSVFGFLSVLVLVFSISAVNVANAGGGGVDTRVYNTDDSHWNIVRVYFDTTLFTCKGMVVSFNFETPESGDKISGINGDNSSTITDTNQEIVNGKQFLRCSTYAKVYSSELKWNRILNISFKGENLEGGRTIAISFGTTYDNSKYPLLPWEGSSDVITSPAHSASAQTVSGINAWILNDQLVDSKNNRQITVKWGAFDGNPGTFSIYASPNKNGWEKLAEGERGPSATIILKSDHDYHIQVRGCQDKVGTCADSNILTLPKLSPLKQRSTDNIEPFRIPDSTVSPTPNTDDQKVDELNKKVENLQNQLQESQKNQSALETRINDLVDFIKRIFPFFK